MRHRDKRLTFPFLVLILSLCNTGLQGCPTGWTPAYDPTSKTTISCTLATDCEPGSQCRWSPYSTELMCCRYFPTMAQGPPPGLPTPPWYVAPVKQLQQPTFPTPPPIPSLQEPEVPTPPEIPELPSSIPQIPSIPPIPGEGTPPVIPSLPEGVTPPGAPEGAGEATPPENPSPPSGLPSPQPQVATGTPVETVLPPGPALGSPVVSPIIVGKWTQTGDPNVVQRSGSVTLISDNGYNIVVDTGVTCRVRDILNGLALRGLHPNIIQMVVLTHGHPDHFGNVALFPNSQFVYWQYFYKQEQFMTFGLNQADSVRLTDKTELWKTPGHTPESVSLIARNVQNMGVVAITGDLFISENDILTPSLWQSVAWDASIQQESRNTIICMASWIVPGHSRMFAVTDTMRSSAGCSGVQSVGQVEPSSPPAPLEPETTPAEARVLQEARVPPTQPPPPSLPRQTPVYAKIIGTPPPPVIYARYIYNQTANLTRDYTQIR